MNSLVLMAMADELVKLAQERELKVKDVGEGKGRGVVALKAFSKGQVVEVAPIIFKFGGFDALGKKDLAQYELAWGRSAAMSGGLLHFYNHSDEPNIALERDLDAGEVTVRALKDIEPGDELCHHYKTVWFGKDKTAFNEAAANKVLSLAKRLQLPKASKAVMPGLGGIPAYKSTMKDAFKAGRLGGFTPEQVTEAVGEMPGVGVSKQMGRAIFPGGERSLPKALRVRWTDAKMLEKEVGPEFAGKITGPLGPEPAHLPAGNMKMLHAVLKGHELDEATVRGGIGAVHLGHRSPDVIFKEHNRLMTLPKEHEAIREFMKPVRQKFEGAWLFPKGMAYGESPRLSRHARRRLTESAERRTLEAQRASEEEMKAWGAGFEDAEPKVAQPTAPEPLSISLRPSRKPLWPNEPKVGVLEGGVPVGETVPVGGSSNRT